MPNPTSDYGSTDQRDERRDEFDATDPDLWLEDIDFSRATDVDVSDAGDPAFYEAKTDPRRPTIDAFANTLPDPEVHPLRTREEALASFLDTVRRVFGRTPDGS